MNNIKLSASILMVILFSSCYKIQKENTAEEAIFLVIDGINKDNSTLYKNQFATQEEIEKYFLQSYASKEPFNHSNLFYSAGLQANVTFEGKIIEKKTRTILVPHNTQMNITTLFVQLESNPSSKNGLVFETFKFKNQHKIIKYNLFTQSYQKSGVSILKSDINKTIKGSCINTITRTEGYDYSTATEFYSFNGTLLGTCTGNSGKGSSGGGASYCDANAQKNGLTYNYSGLQTDAYFCIENQ